MYNDTMADLAYGDSRTSFEIHRDKIGDKALAAHDKAMTAAAEGRTEDAVRLEAEAQALLKDARSLVYTGLMWQQDNGLMEDCY
jgi:hypothetical protein